MRVMGYKLNAKSIINDNLGKCLLSSLILIFPKLIFLCAVIIISMLYIYSGINSFVAISGILIFTALLFVLNSICVPIGELMLSDLAAEKNENLSGSDSLNGSDNIYGDIEEGILEKDLDTAMEFAFFVPNVFDGAAADDYQTKEFKLHFDEEVVSDKGESENVYPLGDPFKRRTLSSVETVFGFGFVRLLKLRFFLITNLVRDIALTALPALVLIVCFFLYAFFSPLPVSAFTVFLIGSLSILLLAVMEIGLEYDKYRYVYLFLDEFSRDFSSYSFPYKSILSKSIDAASIAIGPIRKCEVSFWGWFLIACFSLPIFVPTLYFLSYKKLTLYNVII